MPSKASSAPPRAPRRKRQALDLEQQRLVRRVEDPALAGGHRADGVAMIGMLKGYDARAGLAAVAK